MNMIVALNLEILKATKPRSVFWSKKTGSSK